MQPRDPLGPGAATAAAVGPGDVIDQAVMDFLGDERLLDVDSPPLAADAPLAGAALDLTALLRLVVFLQEEFDFVAGGGDLRQDNFATRERIVAYVQRQVASQHRKARISPSAGHGRAA